MFYVLNDIEKEHCYSNLGKLVDLFLCAIAISSGKVRVNCWRVHLPCGCMKFSFGGCIYGVALAP
jgi:hypothetical protein